MNKVHGNRKPDSYFAERFWEQVDQSGECWLWTGSLSPKGYGNFQARREGKITWKAHRYAYMLLRGKIPKGLHVLHRCDNPQCVNPDHLWLGTNADNHADKLRKGRQSKGRRVNTAKLTEAQVLEIFHSEVPGTRLCEKYGVHNSVIYNIRNRKIWKHVTGPDNQEQNNDPR